MIYGVGYLPLSAAASTPEQRREYLRARSKSLPWMRFTTTTQWEFRRTTQASSIAIVPTLCPPRVPNKQTVLPSHHHRHHPPYTRATVLNVLGGEQMMVTEKK